MNIEFPTDADPVKIIHGDCLDVLRAMPAGCVDAVVTDPPYLLADAQIEYQHAGVCDRVTPTKVVGHEWGYDLKWVDAVAALQPQHWVVFASYKMIGELTVAISKYADVACVFVWRKPNAPNMVRPVPRLDCEFIVWAKTKSAGTGRMGEFKSQVIDMPHLQAGCMADERLLKPGSGQAAHPCQKPVKLLRMFVSRLPCESIIDPFAGTGTTAAAAMREGRRCLLVEREAEYVEIIKKRLWPKGELFS